jgi:hypothetical protein
MSIFNNTLTHNMCRDFSIHLPPPFIRIIINNLHNWIEDELAHECEPNGRRRMSISTELSAEKNFIHKLEVCMCVCAGDVFFGTIVNTPQLRTDRAGCSFGGRGYIEIE